MPKLFNVPWGKKKGGVSSSSTTDSKPGATIFNTGSTNGGKDNSLAMFGQTITLDDEDEQENKQAGGEDDTVDEVLGLLPSESCCPNMSLKYVSYPICISVFVVSLSLSVFVCCAK